MVVYDKLYSLFWSAIGVLLLKTHLQEPPWAAGH